VFGKDTNIHEDENERWTARTLLRLDKEKTDLDLVRLLIEDGADFEVVRRIRRLGGLRP
jgi:hypothetical protein